MDGKGRNREGRDRGSPLTEDQGKREYRGVERRGLGKAPRNPHYFGQTYAPDDAGVAIRGRRATFLIV